MRVDYAKMVEEAEELLSKNSGKEVVMKVYVKGMTGDEITEVIHRVSKIFYGIGRSCLLNHRNASEIEFGIREKKKGRIG